MKVGALRRIDRLLAGAALLAAPVVLAVALMASGGAWLEAVRDAELDTGRLTASARTVAALASDPVSRADRRGVAAALAAPGPIPGVVYRRIEAADGRRLAESGALGEAAVAADMAPPGLKPQFRSRTAQVAAPIERDGKAIGRVVLLTRSVGVFERLAGQWSLMLSAAAAALAGALFIVGRMLEQRTAPVRRLARALAEASSDPAAAAPLAAEEAGPIGELVEGVNGLLGGLGRRQAQAAIQLRRLEDEVAARSAAAEQAVRDEATLAAAVDLELKAGLKGLLSRALAGDPRIGRAIAGLLESLQSLIDADAPVEAASMDLAELAEEAVGLFAAQAQAKGIDLALYVDPATPARMTGDPGRVRRIIGRLTAGAVLHTRAGGVLVEIEPDKADRVRISVRDTGPGFTAEQLAAIAAPPVGRLRGLAACKAMAEAMGGAFRASGGAGRGGSVAIVLPLGEVEPAADWPRALHDSALAVIDHPGGATRRALSRYLARAGYRPAEPGAAGEPALVFAAPDALAAIDSTLAPIVAVGAEGVEGEALLRQGAAQATLPALFRRADLARLLADVAAGQPLGTEAPRHGELLDPKMVDRLKAMAGDGGVEIAERARAVYQARTPRALSELRSAAEIGDLAAVARLAHSLIGLSQAVGAGAVSRFAASIEQAARAGRAPSDAEVARLGVALKETLVAMEAEAPPPQPVAPRERADHKALMDELDQAIDRNELSLVYQAQYDRDGREILGVEALIRWAHPVRGQVQPAEFIPIAEAHGRINRLTSWVLSRALAEIGPIAGLQLAFNASALEFGEPGVVDRIARMAAAAGVDPRRLEVEITETAILNNEAQVKANMTALKAMGLTVALDDFGAGHSSLSHLRRYPFDKLKIDREFITDCTSDVQSATVVHAVVSIGRALGMKVVAEGVQTEAQRQFLKIAGVHAMQGFLFGKPLTVEALKQLVADGRQRKAG